MSPESISKNQYSTKSDVWSFGVTIVEIWSQQTPYPQLTLLEIVKFETKKSFFPPLKQQKKIISLLLLQKEY